MYIKLQLAPAAVSRATTLAANEVGSMFSTWVMTRDMQGIFEAAINGYSNFACAKNVEKGQKASLKILEMLSPKGILAASLG